MLGHPREIPCVTHAIPTGRSYVLIVADLAGHAWRGVWRQLLAQSLLAVDHEGDGTLALTENSRDVLKGERTLMFRRESEKKSRSAKSASSRSKDSGIVLPPDAQQRFENLRIWRSEVASGHGAPAYVIFHDGTMQIGRAS